MRCKITDKSNSLISFCKLTPTKTLKLRITDHDRDTPVAGGFPLQMEGNAELNRAHVVMSSRYTGKPLIFGNAMVSRGRTCQIPTCSLEPSQMSNIYAPRYGWASYQFNICCFLSI